MFAGKPTWTSSCLAYAQNTERSDDLLVVSQDDDDDQFFDWESPPEFFSKARDKLRQRRKSNDKSEEECHDPFKTRTIVQNTPRKKAQDGDKTSDCDSDF